MPNRTRRAPVERAVNDRASARSLAGELRVVIARTQSRMRSERGAGELGEGAYYVLGLLSDEGSLSLKALSDRAHVSPASMSQTVNRLIDGGLAQRVQDPSDRRKVLLSTTKAGRDLLGQTARREGDWLTSRLSEVTPYERVVLREAGQILTRIVDL